MIRCPACGNFVMKGDFEGIVAEVNCTNGRCKATLEVLMKSGKPTVTVLATKK